jgi:CPA2 family monovalent cation:H+ antiporter-2
MNISILQLVVVLLACAVIVVSLARLAHLPALLGYLVLGALAGPHALGWVPEREDARHLAEFGIVFLMFSIGLEFSLPKLNQMKRTVFGLGTAEVVGVMLLTLAAGTLAGLDWRASVALGGVLAMSSTAIVARMLAERAQLESPHGREVLGVLLFQDLAVVPLLILIPAMARGGDDLLWQVSLALGKAALVLLVLLFLGQRLMRRWFHIIAARKSQELFTLNVLLITLGLAWLTDLAGISMALGAFLAGMLIAETEFRHRVEEEIKPFRDVLLGLFFVTVGMSLDLQQVLQQPFTVLLLFVLPVLCKGLLVAALSRASGSSAGTALRSALALAQGGEFGLVLLSLATQEQLLPHALGQAVIAGLLLSMLLAPLLIQNADRIALRLISSEWMTRSLALHRVASESLMVQQHVLILGYGRTGQQLAHLFEADGLRVLALDLDPERVRDAAAAGEPVVYADSTRRESLIAAGVMRAAVLVVSFDDTPAALQVLEHVRQLGLTLPVVVRTDDDSDLDRLMAAGATEVVPARFETSLMLASHVLVLAGIPLRRVLQQIRDVRDQRYSLMRGFFHGLDEEPEQSGEELRLHSLALEAGAWCIGRSVSAVDLPFLNAQLTLIRRGNARIPSPSADEKLQLGDVLVIRGDAQALSAAEMRLIQGQI